MSDIAQANNDPRRCTCHPDDDPPRPCAEKYALTECRVSALEDAMWQLLDDMGKTGVNVCLGAKVDARIAYEPFRDKSEPEYDDWLTYAEAKALRAAYEDRH